MQIEIGSWRVFLRLLNLPVDSYNVQTVSLFLLSSYYTLLKDASFVAVIALLLYVGCYQVLYPPVHLRSHSHLTLSGNCSEDCCRLVSAGVVGVKK